MRRWNVLILVAIFLACAMPQQVVAQEDWDDADVLVSYFSGNQIDDRRDWRPWAVAAIMICILANSLLYVLAKTLNIQSLERFAVSEFYQVSVSTIMIFVLVLGAQSAFELVEMIIPQGTTTMCAGMDYGVWEVGPIGIAQCKIEEKIIYLEQLYQKAYKKNKDIEWLTTTCIYFMSYPVYCFDWQIELHREMEEAHYIANRVAPIAINMHGQYMFLDYVAKNMLSVFLPLGLILRIFPVFRGIGGLFIAISLAFYFVFPITYILMDPTTVRPDPESLIEQSSVQKPDACFNSFSGFVDMVTTPVEVELEQREGTNINTRSIGEELADIQIETFFYPLVALGASILFINSIASLLGGDSGQIMHFLSKVI